MNELSPRPPGYSRMLICMDLLRPCSAVPHAWLEHDGRPWRMPRRGSPPPRWRGLATVTADGSPASGAGGVRGGRATRYTPRSTASPSPPNACATGQYRGQSPRQPAGRSLRRRLDAVVVGTRRRGGLDTPGRRGGGYRPHPAPRQIPSVPIGFTGRAGDRHSGDPLGRVGGLTWTDVHPILQQRRRRGADPGDGRAHLVGPVRDGRRRRIPHRHNASHPVGVG